MRALSVLAISTTMALFAAACDGTSATPPADAATAADARAATGSDAATAPPDLAPITCVDAGGDTYCNYARGFFTTYCISCHDAKDATGRDWTQYAKIQANAMPIACGVSTTALAGCPSNIQPRQFPVGTGPKPSDAERDRLVAWIMAGLPQ